MSFLWPWALSPYWVPFSSLQCLAWRVRMTSIPACWIPAASHSQMPGWPWWFLWWWPMAWPWPSSWVIFRRTWPVPWLALPSPALWSPAFSASTPCPRPPGADWSPQEGCQGAWSFFLPPSWWHCSWCWSSCGRPPATISCRRALRIGKWWRHPKPWISSSSSHWLPSLLLGTRFLSLDHRWRCRVSMLDPGPWSLPWRITNFGKVWALPSSSSSPYLLNTSQKSEDSADWPWCAWSEIYCDCPFWKKSLVPHSKMNIHYQPLVTRKEWETSNVRSLSWGPCDHVCLPLVPTPWPPGVLLLAWTAVSWLCILVLDRLRLREGWVLVWALETDEAVAKFASFTAVSGRHCSAQAALRHWTISGFRWEMK